MNDSFLIHHFQKILNQSDEHILINNFNFYYKNWENNQINKKHKMTTNLFKHVKQSNLILIIFTNIITCDFHESKIIIDLIFVFSTVHDQLIYYQIATELDKISNHKLIKTFFYFNIRMRKMIKHRSWKKTNVKTIKKISNMFWISKHLNSSTEVEQYVVYLLQFIKNLMKKTVSWIKNNKKQFFDDYSI